MRETTKRRGVQGRLTAAVLIAAMALTAVGCEKPDWENPDYVAQMLAEGDERQKRQAVELVRHFPEDRRDEIAPSLTAIYLESDELRDDVMQYLIQWRTSGAAEAYVEEMKTDATGYAEHAAEVLGRIEHRESIPAMIEAFEATGNEERRDGILRGLARMPHPSVTPIAVEVLGLNVDNHRISMLAHTCDMVGDLALEHPEAIEEDLMRALARAVFLSDEMRRTVHRECRVAIQKIGEPMVPYLVELFNEENEDVQRLLMTYEQSTDEYQFPFNRAKHEAALLLTAMRSPTALELFLEDMTATKELPEFGGARRASWVIQEAQILGEMMYGLGEFGDPSARAVLERALTGDLVRSEWSAITNDASDFQFRQNAAEALARLGDRAARPALLRAARADIIRGMARHFASVARQAQQREEDNPYSEADQHLPQWKAALAYVYLAEAGDRQTYVNFVESLDEGTFREKVESFIPAFDVMDECEGNEDASERAQCFGGFLDSEDEYVRNKAIYELSRLDSDSAGPIIAEAIRTSDLSMREVVVFAGYRVPTPELVTAIDEILEEESGRSAREYRQDRQRLQILRAFILRNDTSSIAAAE